MSGGANCSDCVGCCWVVVTSHQAAITGVAVRDCDSQHSHQQWRKRAGLALAHAHTSPVRSLEPLLCSVPFGGHMADKSPAVTEMLNGLYEPSSSVRL